MADTTSMLTVFMPSYRGFSASFRAIQSALDFCISCGAHLVVADNSDDVQKAQYWQGRFQCCTYLVTTGLDAKANFLAALFAVKTDFVLAMGDDDELLAGSLQMQTDLSCLPVDHIGVRPKTDVWTQMSGLIRSKTFSICGATPSERMFEYNRLAEGDNGAFYSIFRRTPYLRLMVLFFRHHPTGGGYCDWALVMALFAWGKMVYDPGLVYRYNFDQWHGAAATESRANSLYRAAGLPEGSRKFQYLLMFLDIYIYCCPGFCPLGPHDAANAQQMAAGPFFDAFLKKVGTEPENFSPDIHRLCKQASRQSFALDRFRTGLAMAETIQSGLKDRYIRFFNIAMGEEAKTMA
jgi:hypothetical protein